MSEIGGLPPSVLIIGGIYLISQKTYELSILSNPYFYLGMILVIIGSYMHMSHLGIWPFNKEDN